MTAEYQKSPFTLPEEGKTPESGELLRKNIGKLYTQEMKQRRELVAEVEKKFEVFLGAAFNDENGEDDMEATKKIRDEWLKRVRKNTHFLDFVDSMNIDMFGDDIAKQGKFPDVDISFSNRELREETALRDSTIIGGATEDKRVQVIFSKPSLVFRFLNFLNFGYLDYATSSFVHEMVHIKNKQDQKDNNLYGCEDSTLTEAQAFLTGVFSQQEN